MVDLTGDVFDGHSKFGEVLTPGHNADEIRTLGEINNTAVMKLFVAGIEILSFTEFMGNNKITRDSGDDTTGKFRFGEEIKGVLRQVLVEIGGVVKNAEK